MGLWYRPYRALAARSVRNIALFLSLAIFKHWGPRALRLLVQQVLKVSKQANPLTRYIDCPTDMYFRHQLGKMVGINTILLVISPFSGGIIGGPIMEHLGWRWSQWISGILMFVAFFAYIFFVPEVRF